MLDKTLIYARAVGLVVSVRDLIFSDGLGHELSPYPVAIFEENGAMRISKGKATFKTRRLVNVRSRIQLTAKSVIVVDAAAMVWTTLDWPSRGT